MSTEPVIESGLQVITRLIDRPSVQDLDRDLFFNGLENTDVIEIKGNVSSGLTKLLVKLIAKCILPLKYNGLYMDVLFINTENQFRVTELYKNIHTEISDIQGPVNVDNLVKNLLNNLKIINCYNIQQFIMTVNSLDNILLKNKRVGLIVMDSISAYSWQRKGETYKSHFIKLLNIIKKVTTDFKVVMIYTKEFDFFSKKQTLEWLDSQNIFRYEIILSRNENTNTFICDVKSRKDSKQLCYEFKNGNFTWLEVKQL